MARQDDEAYRQLAGQRGVALLFEAFADRAYTAAGDLLDRAIKGAVHVSLEQMMQQVLQLAQQGSVTSHCGKMIPLQADTICVHGDNETSIRAAREIHLALKS